MSLDTFQLPENLDLTASKTLLEAAGCSPKFIALYEKESQISFKHLKAIFNKSKDHSSRETAIKRFLQVRNAVVFNNYSFFSIPYSPINQLCADLMSAMVKDDELLIQILVPTVNTQLVFMAGDELKELTETMNAKGERILKPHTFIISQNGEGIIPLESWFTYYAEYVKTEEDSYHHIYTNSDNKLIFLDESEIDQLRQCAKPDSDLFFADMEIRKKILKNKNTLAGALYELCGNIRQNSDGGKGSSASPHDDIFTHIRTFNEILNQLDATIKEEVLSKRAGGETLGEYLNVISAINPSKRTQYATDDVATCTFTNGSHIKEILKTHLGYFSSVHLRVNNIDAPRVDDEKLFIQQISDKLEKRRGDHPQNAIYFYSQPNLLALENLLSVYDQYLESNACSITHYEAAIFFQKLFGEDMLNATLKTLSHNVLRAIFDGAVTDKNETMIISIMATGVKLKTWFNQTYLSYFLLAAITNKWVAVSKVLLERTDIYFDVRNSQGKTALHLAAEHGLTEIVDIIVNKNLIDVESTYIFSNTYTCTALGIAAMNGHIDIVEALIKVGANYKSDLIIVKACSLQHFKVVERLLDQGASPNAKDQAGTSVLHYLAQYGQDELMKKFIKKNACINIFDIYSMSPLFHAIQSSHSQCVTILINNGADVNRVDNAKGTQSTALHYAALANDIVSARLLIDAGAMTSCKQNEGSTPLHFAVNNGNLDMVKLLCQHKADPYAVTYTINQDSPLELAVRCNHVEVAAYLLDIINYKNYYQIIKQRKSPDHEDLSLLMIACKKGGERLFKLLLDIGEDPTRKDASKYTAYHYAVLLNNIVGLHILLNYMENVEDLNIIGKNGFTPLSIAIFLGFEECVSALVDKKANIPETIGNIPTGKFLDDKIKTPNQTAEHINKWLKIKAHVVLPPFNDEAVSTPALLINQGVGFQLAISSKDRKSSVSSSNLDVVNNQQQNNVPQMDL